MLQLQYDVLRMLTVNISETITDRAAITIANI